MAVAQRCCPFYDVFLKATSILITCLQEETKRATEKADPASGSYTRASEPYSAKAVWGIIIKTRDIGNVIYCLFLILEKGKGKETLQILTKVPPAISKSDNIRKLD